jgi:YVTN family beta-propeller protein
MHPNGKTVYVTNGGDANVSFVDTETLEIKANVPVGKRPWNMAITADGKKLYVAAGRSDLVNVIDTEAAKTIKEIPVGKLPWGVVIK